MPGGDRKRLKVVGEAADGLKVVDLVARLKPRILILGLAMPGLNGLEITRQVHQQSPATAVIVLSMYSQEQDVIQALRNGAAGYVVKHAKPAELGRAIRKVVAGHRYLSEPLSQVVGEAADGLKVVGLIERRRPRVLVMAVGMPGLNSFEVTLRGFASGRRRPRSFCSRCTRESNTSSKR